MAAFEKLVKKNVTTADELLSIKDEKLTIDDAAALASLRKSLLKERKDKKAWTLGERGENFHDDSDHQIHVKGRHEDSSVKAEDLLAVLSNDVGNEAVLRDRFLKRRKARKTVDAPLPKIQSEKIARQAAYEGIGKDVGKWDTAVYRQKGTDQIHFPLDTQKVQLIDAKDYVDSTVVGTELEKKLNAIHGPTRVVSAEGEENEEALNDRIRLQELLERRNKLAKFRAMQSYFEAKMRRKKKIKSKSYHRVQKKERLKLQLKEFEELKETDPEKALGRLEELERRRVEERMSLKHRPGGSKSKWAHSQALRAKYDPEARKALAEQLRLSRQLTKKVSLEDSSDEEGIVGLEELVAGKETDGAAADPWAPEKPTAEPQKPKHKEMKVKRVEINPEDFMVVKASDIVAAQLPDEVNQGDDALDDDVEYGADAALVAEAFAGDDVVADFQKEKDDARGAGKVQEEPTTLPGWGDWGGKGVAPAKRRRKRKHVRMPSPPPRKDDTLGNVIVSETGDAGVRKAQVSELPFPFTNAHDYEASMRMPMGNTWVPETAASSMRAPRVVTKAGAIINPLDASALAKLSKKKKKQ